MALDENIYDLRRDKLKKIEALGQPAYPSKYEFTHTIPQILAAIQRQERPSNWRTPRVNVRVAGRIMAIRLMGKAGLPTCSRIGQATADLRQERRGRREGIRALQAARSRRPHRGQRIPLPHPDRRTSDPCGRDYVPLQDLLPLPEKWHGLRTWSCAIASAMSTCS